MAETSRQLPTPIKRYFGDDGFWYENKPFGYESMTGFTKEYWTKFIESTTKENGVKPIGI